MALSQKNVPLNFSQGVDTKTDPFQIPLGKFLSLKNMVFNVGGRLTKRNGFGNISSLPEAASYLTTFNGNLTAIESSLQAYSSGTKQWQNKGKIVPTTLKTLPLIRNNFNQEQCDAAISPNGLVCTVYTEFSGTGNSYKYAVADAITGQNVLAPSAISSGSTAPDSVYGYPRVFSLGNYFIIVYTNFSSGTYHLKYVAINIGSLAVSSPQDISSSYDPTFKQAFDGAVFGSSLYLAWNDVSSGGIQVAFLTAQLSLSSAINEDPSNVATAISVCADQENSIIWVTYWDLGTLNINSFAVDTQLNLILPPTVIQSTAPNGIANLTASAQSGLLTIFYETMNAYSYDSTILTNYISSVTCTQAGAIGPSSIILRSVGLSSKSFIVDGVIYFVCAYQSPYQPTYFVSDSVGNINTKIAYGNGGGYIVLGGLPSVSVSGTVASFPYRFKDLISAVNKNTNVASGTQTAGIYSQTGLNLASVNFNSRIVSSEIGQNLNISGGFLWSYDGYLPVEQNFHVWPDSVEAAAQADITKTGTVSNVTTPTIITALSSVTGLVPGMTISGAGIPASAIIVSVGTTTVTMSVAATAAHAAETITFGGNVSAQQYYYQVTYEWTDNQGNAYRSAPSIPVTATASAAHTTVVINVPTLRLTYKIANPVKIVIYRWSVAQQIYYQITSIDVPVLNNTTIDSVSFTDVSPDSQIIGNNIIYTNGGVVENIGPPATNIMTLFDTRFWLVDAEDPNLLWFSKQVIESTPVEMSDLFTFFIAPTTAAQGSTGPITALSVMDDKLIIFKQNAIYYLNGVGPDNTGSNNQYSQPVFITSTVGCSNPSSIVFMQDGLMFQSDKGIWLLGRNLSTSYVGAGVEEFNSSIVQSSVNIPETNEVRFTLNTGEQLMFDYYYEQWGPFEGAAASSSCIYNGLHTLLSPYGAVLQETPGVYMDGQNPVLVSLLTGHIQLQGISGYQRIFEIQLLGQYFSPHLLNVELGYNFGALSEQALIQPTNATGVYGSDSIYGDTSPFGGLGNLEQWRIQPATQKCQAFQMSLKEVYDPSLGVPAGEGLTLSSFTCLLGLNRGYRPVKATNTIGTS